jgi:hypothetical protein
MTGSRGLGNVAAETDCVAGVVGLELRNPLGSKSAGIAGGICADLAEMARQRQFASELRRLNSPATVHDDNFARPCSSHRKLHSSTAAQRLLMMHVAGHR